MTAKPTATLLKAFQEEAEARYPEEACGYVVKVGKKQRFVPCKNSAAKPKNDFRIDQDEYQRCADIGEIIAVWHTHPDKTNQPSECDRVECENTGLPWFINAITKGEEGFVFGETFLLEPEGYMMDYLGRPYHYGLIDCYSLLRDYYKGEYGVELAVLKNARDTRFWDFGNPVIENSYAELGFERVYDAQPKPGDVILIQTGGSVANHVAIYIGDDMILHHVEDRLSSRSVYGGYWHKHTAGILRHPEVDNGTDKGNSGRATG